MILSHIVAMSENRVIGKQGQIPWHLHEEMQYFKRTTMGHAVIMGRKTFETLPKPLPGRLNVVMTRQSDYEAPGAIVVPGVDEALAACEKRSEEWGEEVFVAGGGQIYRDTMEMVDRIYLTIVHTVVGDGDAFYPAFNQGAFELKRKELKHDDPSYTVMLLERK